ncbi:tetratricopeptide repeat protein [Streptomyces sp. NPDC005409]|uniref:tetratricopeptide repeat protein n=1 Tax=Streptomyces sp. NPDC005409 TaxID=3155342 RepID=UPI003451D558
MNTDDLSWQAGSYGGVHPRKVDLLLEHGHLDLVIRAARERDEWFCAERAARELCRSGQFVQAVEVIEPFAATGWRPALSEKADVLLRAGRTDEALDLVRPDEEARTSPYACRDFAELLVRAGRVDEAIDLLVPHLGGWWIRSALVDITAGQGRDERVLELIAPYAESARRALEKDRLQVSDQGELVLQARMLERMGRAAEAISALGADIAARRYGTQNTLTAYAELLSRHGRFDALRELATAEHARTVLHVFAGALRDYGRPEEAETVMREAIAADDWVGYRAWLSAVLLEDGRLDDAITVAEPGFSWYDCSNLLAPLVHELFDRPEELLHLLDHPLTVPHHGHEEFQHAWRAFALARLGRAEEAVAVVEAHPAPYEDPRMARADLLVAAGRLADAATELRNLGTIDAREALFEVLVKQGRAAEAMATHPTVAEQRAARQQAAEAATPSVPAREDGYSLEPPF